MKQPLSNGRTAASADPAVHALSKRIDSVVTQQPALRALGEFYRVALPLIRAAQASGAPFTLAPTVARQKLQAGLPLLVGEALPLDEAQLRTLFLQLCRLLEAPAADTPTTHAERGRTGKSLFAFFSRGAPDPVNLLDRVHHGYSASLRAAAAQQIRQAVEQQWLDLGELWLALLAGDTAHFAQIAGHARLDGALLHTLGQHTLRPALRRWMTELKPLADFDNAWSAGVWRHLGCPMCGSAPQLSEIQGKEGARRLRCGACGMGWGYPRLTCAFCANADYHTLGYLSLEGEEEKYRLQTCALCRRYLKVIVTFDPLPVDQLPLEDLATLYLDTIAVQHGFLGASTTL